MNHKEKAKEIFLKGNNCAQAVFGAFSDVTGIDEETALKISASFGGGMGHMGEVCGAVSGMFMAAGVVFGYGANVSPEIKQKHNELVAKMANRFKEKFPSLLCRDLMKGLSNNEIALPDGEEYKNRPCLIFVEYATEIMDELLDTQN